MSSLPDTSRFTPREIAHAIDLSEQRTREYLRLWRPKHEGHWQLNGRELLSFISYHVRSEKAKRRKSA